MWVRPSVRLSVRPSYLTSNSARHPFHTQMASRVVPQFVPWMHVVLLSCFAIRTSDPAGIPHSFRFPSSDSQVTRWTGPLPPLTPATVTSNSPRHPLLTQR